MVRGARRVQRLEVAQVARGLHRSRRQTVARMFCPAWSSATALASWIQRALGGAVPRPPRTGDTSELRSDQDDASAAARFHGRNGVLAEQEGGIEIDCH